MEFIPPVANLDLPFSLLGFLLGPVGAPEESGGECVEGLGGLLEDIKI